VGGIGKGVRKNQELEDSHAEKEKEDNMENRPENNQHKKDLSSTMEFDRDQEMTPSQVGTKDHELQDILKREHLNLENFLDQGQTKGVDSLPQEEFNRVQ